MAIINDQIENQPSIRKSVQMRAMPDHMEDEQWCNAFESL